MRVYGTAGSKEGITVAKKCGCLQIFNHDNEELNAKIRKRVGGIDVLVENRPNLLEKDLELMNPGGRIILLGPHEDEIKLYLRPFLTKEVYLTGVNLGNATVNDLLGKFDTKIYVRLLPNIFRDRQIFKRSPNHPEN